MKAFRGERQRGGVLILVLWSIVILSSLVAATSISFRVFTNVISIDRNKTKMDGLLSAGLEAAIANLLYRAPNDYRMPQGFHLKLSIGEIRAQFTDEQGRIDINKANPPVLIALFRTLGMPDAPRAAQAVITWRKGNANSVLEAKQTTDATQKSSGSDIPVLTFDDVHQLSEVPNFNADFIPLLIPLVTVFGSASLNPLTASADVLASLPGANRARVERFLELRDRQPVKQEQVEEILGPSASYTEIATDPAIRIDLMAVLNDGYAASATAVIKTSPRDVQPYRVLAWASHPILQN